MPEAPSPAQKWFAPCLLGLLAFAALVYWPVTQAGFVFWDDWAFISRNPIVAKGLSWETAGWALGNHLIFFDGFLEYFSPLTALSRLADTSLYGVNNAPAFHGTSLMLHLLNICLVAMALRLLTGRCWPSLAVAGIFALHPLAVEPVSWLSARKDLVYGSTFLLMVLVYAWYTRRRGWPRYLLLCATFLLACMSKPMVVTLPCALLLLDVWPLGRLTLPPRLRDALWWRNLGQLLLEKAPFFLGGIGVALLALKSQRDFAAVVPMDLLPPEVRVGNVAWGYLAYVSKFLAPTELTVHYRFTSLMTVWDTAPRLLLLLAACGLALALARRCPWVFTGWFWFVGILLPVSGFVQIGASRISERYMYIPMIGLAIAVVWTGVALWEKRAWRPVLLGLYLGWLLPLAVAAHWQTRTWNDAHTFGDHQMSLDPQGWNFLENYTGALVETGQYDRAWTRLDDLIRARKYAGVAWRRKAEIAARWGSISEAETALHASVEADPQDLTTRSMLAGILVSQNRLIEAIPHFEALEQHGNTITPAARVQLIRGYMQAGRRADAIAQYDILFHSGITNQRIRQELIELLGLPPPPPLP